MLARAVTAPGLLLVLVLSAGRPLLQTTAQAVAESTGDPRTPTAFNPTAGLFPESLKRLAVPNPISFESRQQIADSLASIGEVAGPGDYDRVRDYHRAELAMRWDLRAGDTADSHRFSYLFNQRAYELAVVARRQGEPSAAMEYLELNAASTLAGYGADHYTLAWTYNALGNVRHDLGDYGGAIARYEDALRITRACRDRIKESLVPYVNDVRLQIWNNLAHALVSIADYDSAEVVYQRSLDYDPESLQEIADYASTLVDLADLYRLQGRVALSLETHDRAAIMTEADSLRDLPLHVDRLAYRARALVAGGRSQEGIGVMEEALRRFTAIHDSTHFDYAWLLGGFGEILEDSGSPNQAIAYYERAMQGYGRSLGEEHPRVGEVHLRMATTFAALGDLDAALSHALKAEAVSQDHLRLVYAYLDEPSALALSQAAGRGLDVAITLGSTAPAPELWSIWGALVRSRSLVQDAVADRLQRLQEARGDVRDRHASVSRRLANLTVLGLSRPLDDDSRDLLQELRAERISLARTVAGGEPAAGFGGENVVASLPAHAALVSYVKYRPTGDTRRRDCYAAFLVRKPDLISFIPLGAADSVDQVIRAWVQEIRKSPRLDPEEAEQTVRSLGNLVREAVWDPVQALLSEESPVLVVPDGALSLVNFNALPAPGGRYLIDEPAVVCLLSTERDLAAGETTRGAGLLAVGGLDYDRDVTAGGGSVGVEPVFRKLSCEEFRNRRFAPLPGSETEVHAVNRLWEAKAGGGTRRLLTGALGSELGVREGVLGKRVLHFATHGFVLDPLCGADEVGRLDPLLLSGLILSGGNRSDPESDGILTAAEVTTLDLSGVELAVLSACDTGGGEIVDGEGVLGLRRAFWQAGVRSLVVSLWPVGDRVAQEWMGGFYEAYLEGGSPSGAALAASRGMLDRRREQRLSTHPIYWAGFVTTGTGWN